MAVPAGDYRVACSLDLSPLLGKTEGEAKVRIETPPPGLLERYLADLSSPEISVRLRAIRELGWFERDAARVVPALLGFRDRAAESERIEVLWTLRSFPAEMARHGERVLRILEAPEGVSLAEREAAASLVADTAPWDERVEKALAALPADPGRSAGGVRVELVRYRARHGR